MNPIEFQHETIKNKEALSHYGKYLTSYKVRDSIHIHLFLLNQKVVICAIKSSNLPIDKAKEIIKRAIKLYKTKYVNKYTIKPPKILKSIVLVPSP